MTLREAATKATATLSDMPRPDSPNIRSTSEELERLEQIASIRSGETHSNVLSISFTGYEVPPSAYFISHRTPTITISRRKIAFNKACFTKLEGCTHFEMLYHPILQAIVIRSCDETAANAVCIDDLRRKTGYAPFAAYAFSSAIYEKMNWLPDYDFRFRGVYRERGTYRAVIFYLDEPQILVGKHAKKLQEQYQLDESDATCFIPYQNIAYPSQWAERSIGISYGLRKQRDQLVDTITADDISQESMVVENPLIGEIPSREEALAEIQELLISM